MSQNSTKHTKPIPQATLPSVTEIHLKDRQEALAAGFGLFKGKDVFPEDGLEYQLEVRAEWR